MGNLLLMVVVGLAVGIFVISLGGGGGAIYLGALTAIFQLSPGAAAATSIVTSLPALIMGSWSYYRRGLINFRLGNRMLIAAIPSIFVGSFIIALAARAGLQASDRLDLDLSRCPVNYQTLPATESGAPEPVLTGSGQCPVRHHGRSDGGNRRPERWRPDYDGTAAPWRVNGRRVCDLRLRPGRDVSCRRPLAHQWRQY